MQLYKKKEHKKVLNNVPVIEISNGKSLKDCLVGAILPKFNESSRCKP